MFTAFLTRPPLRASTICSATTTATFTWASWVAAPKCGHANHVVQGQQGAVKGRFLFKNVQSRAGHFAAFQALVKGRLIDDAAAGAIDQTHSIFHGGDLLGARSDPSSLW